MMLSSNLRFLRKSRGLTQAELAEALGLKRSSLATYEEERAEPKLNTLLKLADYFSVDPGELISGNLQHGGQKGTSGPDVLAITLDQDGDETISLVPEKAAAGYLSGYSDPEYLGSLSQFKMPFAELRHGGTSRIFQTKGESMLPIVSGSYLLCSYLEKFKGLKARKLYVIVSREDGIVFKRLGEIRDDKVELISDNRDYKPLLVSRADIIEIWKVEAIISFDVNAQTGGPQIQSALDELKVSIEQVEQVLRR